MIHKAVRAFGRNFFSGRRGIERLEDRALLSVAPTQAPFVVPTTGTTSNQEQSDVAIAPNGDFVVVWQHEVNSTNHDIRFRRFNANGTAKDLNDLSVVSSGLNETAARVSMADDGSFVVVWQTDVSAGNSDVFYRRFDATGAPLDPVAVSVDTDSDNQVQADIFVHGDGNFEVVWDDLPFVGGNGTIKYRRFAADGTAIDADEVAVAATGKNETQPRISGARDGVSGDTFVVTWTADAAGDSDVLVRSFDEDGNPLIGTTTVDADLVGPQFDPSVVMDNSGSFIVVYAHQPNANDQDIYLRRFNSIGLPITARQAVDTTVGVVTNLPDIGLADTGNFVVAYQIQSSPLALLQAPDVRYLQFNTNGTPRGAAQSPGSDTAGLPSTPAAAMNAAGEFVLSWEQGSANRDILARNWRTSLTTAGLYNPSGGSFFLRNENSSGVADLTFSYGAPGADLRQALTGDWDGDGVQSIGLYDPTTATLFLRNENSTGVADITFQYGPASTDWKAVVGDWDGDGIETIGLYSPTEGAFFLRNSNSQGIADLTFQFGPGGAGLTPLAGDWNGDGVDTIGLYQTTTSTFFYRNTNTPGVADRSFAYGAPGLGLLPIVGDWNRDRIDSAGLYDPVASVFFLKDLPVEGPANQTFFYGPPGAGWMPIVGDWNGPGGAALQLDGEASSVASTDTTLTDAELRPIFNEALARWLAAGADADSVSRLSNLDLQVTDLAGNQLGLTTANTVYIDSNAAGHGWFVDQTPATDSEFAASDDGLVGRSGTAAATRVDLLTVVSHEVGHLLGLDDLEGASADLMSGHSAAGVRKLPSASVVDRIFADS